jgi:hypothetical protein
MLSVKRANPRDLVGYRVISGVKNVLQRNLIGGGGVQTPTIDIHSQMGAWAIFLSVKGARACILLTKFCLQLSSKNVKFCANLMWHLQKFVMFLINRSIELENRYLISDCPIDCVLNLLSDNLIFLPQSPVR